MQEFNTADSRHTFKVDGKTYWIPSVTIEDIATFGELAKLPTEEQAAKFRSVIESKAQADLKLWQRMFGLNPARKAVESLSIAQVSQLFKEWASAQAVLPGESSRSAG